MSLPHPVGKPSLKSEPTALYESRGEEPRSPEGQIQVALPPRAGLQPIEEIQRVLRKRLRFFALVISGGIAVLLLVVFVPALLMPETNMPKIVMTFGVYGAVAVVAVVAAWLLGSSRRLSLGQLRVIEVIV